MKKRILLAVGICLAVFAFVACSSDDEEQTPDYSNVTANIDDEVKACFEATNAFRTGNEANYVNEDGTTTDIVGQLEKLTLDEDLCKAAQIRANEIVGNFSHTRPNGKDCFTVFDDLGISASAKGENIAAGSKTGTATFTQWKEDGKPYSGQGHRRNMLSKNFTKIGIAYTYDANSTYKYYWTMILAK